MKNISVVVVAGSVLVLLLSLIQTSDAHSYFSSMTIDGVVHPEDDCMRPHPSSQYDYPIASLDRTTGLQSNDMTCGWLPSASKAANKKCAVNPGSTITLQWHYERGLGNSDDFIIDPSHKGPCIVYMAKSETGAGAVWFKIFEDGYDTTTKKWCVDKLRANKGKFDVKIPTDITPGNYLFRSELIALHEGDRTNGAQPYIGCAELTVGGSGTVNPGNLVAIPGVYKATDAGIKFDIYTGKNPAYPIPGPAVYRSGSAPAPTPTPATTGKTQVTTGRTQVTTGRQSNTATTGRTNSPVTTGRTNSPVTTGRSTPVSVTTGVSQSTDANAMCYLPGTPNLNGKINRNPPTCGKKAPRARCGDGQCCSQWGYCGPVPQRDGSYYEYVDGREKKVTAAFAFQLYCNKTVGDYRKVPCNTINGGIQDNQIDDDKQTGDSHSLVDVHYLRMLLIIGFSFTILLGYLV